MSLDRAASLEGGIFYFMEEWKPIKDFEHYLVSNMGSIKRLPINSPGTNTRKEHLFKKFDTSCKGYKRVTMGRFGKTKRAFVHRIVAEYFIPNPHNHPIINHKNGVRTDNRVNNLEWCNYSHNSKHGYDFNGRINPLRKLTTKQVSEIRENVFYSGYFISKNAKEYAKKFNVHLDTIRNVVKRRCYL